MRILISLLLSLISYSCFSQTTYEINDFSEKYSGILSIEKGFENEVFKQGNVSIIDSKTNKIIIDIDADELTFDLDKNGAIKTNVLELPYGEQSIIIYEDFNFDGIKDLAVMDGQHSCYHLPSYQVYLDINNTLEYSSGFTSLAQEYCGMFQVDYESKLIHTMTKSGCCWHQFSTFKVVNNIPKPILVIEEDAMDFPFHTSTTIEWIDNEKIEQTEQTIDLKQEGITEVFSFELTKSQKRVVIFNMNNRTLNYVLIRPDKTVEFSFPIETEYKNPDFEIDKNEEYLSFKNQDAIYKVYENLDHNGVKNIGILVQINGKSFNLKGSSNTVIGSLRNVKKVEFDNVVVR